MSAAFLACLAFTLAPAQDGQALHVTPEDDRGATDDGITLATFRAFCDDPALTPEDLGRITASQVQAIYATKFWNVIRGDELPVAVALMVMDHAVNCGPAPSARILQQAIGLSGADVDGWIGSGTLAVVARQDVAALVAKLSTGQERYYRACRGFAEFGHGWLSRLARRTAAALAMNKPATPLTADQLNDQQFQSLATS